MRNIAYEDFERVNDTYYGISIIEKNERGCTFHVQSEERTISENLLPPSREVTPKFRCLRQPRLPYRDAARNI